MSIHVKMQIDYKFNERIAMLSGVQMQSQAPTFVSYIRVSTGKQHQSVRISANVTDHFGAS